MILSDRTLLNSLRLLVGHEDDSLVNPASIDLRVGTELMYQNPYPTGPEDRWWRYDLSDGRPYYLNPGEAVLIATLETITIPNGYVGVCFLKSSRAREGYDHALAGWVDPGWSGILTLEIRNVLQYARLPVYKGFKIVQLAVMKCDAPSLEPYQGNYKGATGVMASYHK